MSTWYSRVEVRNLSHQIWAKGGLLKPADIQISPFLTFSRLSFFHTQLRHQRTYKLLGLPWSLNLKFKSLGDAWQLLLDRPEAWSVLRNCCPAQSHHLHNRVGGFVGCGGLALFVAPHTLWLDSCQAETGSDLAEPSQPPQDSSPCCTTKSKVINLHQHQIQ